jgi:hypothetical protein
VHDRRIENAIEMGAETRPLGLGIRASGERARCGRVCKQQQEMARLANKHRPRTRSRR